MVVCRDERISLFRITFLVLYFFVIRLYFFPIQLYRCISIVLLLVGISKSSYLKLTRLDYHFIIFILFFIGISFARSVVTCDITIPFYMIESILNLCTAVIIYNIYYSQKTIALLMKEIVYALLFQSLFIIAELVFPPCKSFFNQLLPSSVPASKWAWRHVGVTGFAAYNMGVFLALGLFLTVYLFENNEFSIKKTLFLFSCFLSTALLAARSSFIVFFFVFVYFLYFIKRKMNLKFALIILLLFICVFFALYQYSMTNQKFKFIFDWMFSIVLTLFDKGKGLREVDGVKVIGENFYWMPELTTFLFGDGRYAGISGIGYYMETDAGYMRRLLYFGFFLSVFYYITYLYYFVMNAISVKNIQYKIIILSIICIIMIMQYKGDFFIDSGETFRMSFLLIYAFKKDEEKRK